MKPPAFPSITPAGPRRTSTGGSPATAGPCTFASFGAISNAGTSFRMTRGSMRERIGQRWRQLDAQLRLNLPQFVVRLRSVVITGTIRDEQIDLTASVDSHRTSRTAIGPWNRLVRYVSVAAAQHRPN